MAFKKKLKSFVFGQNEAKRALDYSDNPPEEYNSDKKILFNALEKEDVVLFQKRSKQSEEIANNALKDIMIPFPNFDPVDFSEGYRWDVQRKKYGRSYQLYLQSLRMLNDLLIIYEESSDKRYIQKSKEIIDSWIEYMRTEPDNEMIWYDHPTANRAQLIVQFLYYSQNQLEIDYEKYFQVLDRHAKVLSNPEIYNFNNHALMMDRTLLVIGRVMNRQDLYDKGLARAKETFWVSFSSKAVHLENSPDYHRMVVRMYREIEEYVGRHGYSLGHYITEYLKKAEDYFDILVKPDGRLPAVGDSGNTLHSLKNKRFVNFNDYEAGVNLIQRETPKNLYMMFVSGYSTRVHKHLDDLSIILNYNKHDIFVDPGKFNYSKSPIRRYMMKADAHSTLYFEDYKYKRMNENRFTRNVRTTDYASYRDYSYVSGINESFEENAQLQRSIYVLNNHDIIFILDSATSEEETSVIQNFNLHEDIVIEQSRDNEVTLVHAEETVKITQYNGCQLKLVSGVNEEVMAKNTSGFGKTVDTHQLKFKKNLEAGNQYDFITSINLNGHEITNFEMTDSKLLCKVDGYEYAISI